MPPAPVLPPPILFADHRALDFLNTVASPAGEPIDWIADGPSYLSWLRQTAELPPDIAVASAELDRVATEARMLREWFRGFVSRHAGAPLKPSAARALGPLNAALSAAAAHTEIAAGDANAPLVLRERIDWSAAGALLQPPARALADLLCHSDFAQVRHCEGAGCTLWFLDVSKGHRRRWCSMALCGNRAKAAAHRARQREG